MEQKFDIGYDPLEHCVEIGATSFWATDTAIIFLCPRFSTLRPQPVFSGPRDIYCPLVRDNVFVGQSDPLVNYQSYDLVHQLAHLYLQGDGLTSQTVPREVTDWNSCVGMGWASVRNPFNLVYYIACEFRLGEIRICGKLMGGSCQSGMHTDAKSICATVLGTERSDATAFQWECDGEFV